MSEADVVHHIQTKDLRKYYPVKAGVIREKVVGWVKALDGIDLTLDRRQIVGIVGESGSGKTTLAKILLFLERPTGGEVIVHGKNPFALTKNELKAVRRNVQAVFQDPFSSLSPRLWVRDIIGEPLEEVGLNRAESEARVAEVLRLVGLDPDVMKVYPHELSGGQRQRVAIARAISTHPSVIILDEPTSALDVSIRLQIVNLLMHLQNAFDHTYLLIGHDLAMVSHMSTEIAVMYLGKIVEHAEKKELLKNTAHPYTRALISASLPEHPRYKIERNVLGGEIPSPLNIPKGCRFHPRCAERIPVCCEEEPPFRRLGEKHWVTCHRC